MRYMQLKPTMRHAIQSNGTAAVVKLLHDSQELQILRDLHRIDSPTNHTIPLLGTLKVNRWTFVLLPEATPLDDRFKYGRIRDNAVDFSRQLIEGVAFLHNQGIAHLDIKPQNIVIFPKKTVHNRLQHLCPCRWPIYVDRSLVRNSWVDGPRNWPSGWAQVSV